MVIIMALCNAKWNYVKAGVVLTRRQRYGFIRFGSRVDVYLPLDANVKVSIGDHDYLSWQCWG